MKKAIKILTFMLALFGVIGLMVACDGENETDYADYSVTVVDGLGNPMPNVMVKFTNSDGESKKRVTDTEGYAALKNVKTGNYKITLEKGYSTAEFDKSEYELTAETTSLKVIVRDEEKSVDIYGEIGSDAFAYTVSAGSYNIPCPEDEYMIYFVFYAQTKGVYKVTLSSDDEDKTVGYYGIPMFVQTTHRGESEYDGKTFELVIQDTATPYVLGIKSSEAVAANLTIERIGDAPFDPYYAPWTEVTAEFEIEKCDLPDGAYLTDLNVTDKNLTVTLGDDGYYYTSDGKLVYLRINSVSAASYLDVSIAFIAGLVDKNFGQNFGGYVYDENGEFVGKYTYNTMLASYYECCDSSGVYPLTAELAEAIQVHGNSNGWWNPDAANYLFNGIPVVEDNAWLFLCCTVD